MHIRLFSILGLLLLTFIVSPQPVVAQLDSDTELIPYTDDVGILQLNLPAEWDDVKFGEWELDGESVGLLLEASSDLDGFYGTWLVSGLLIGISTELVDETDGKSLLNRYDLSQSCTFDTRDTDVQDVIVNGRSTAMQLTGDSWTDCDGTETYFAILTGVPIDSSGQDFLLFVTAQMVDLQNEGDLFEEMLESLEIDIDAFIATDVIDDAEVKDDAELNDVTEGETESNAVKSDNLSDDTDAEETQSQKASERVEGFISTITEDQALRVHLPAEWDDIQMGPWVVGGETIGTLIEAADNLEALYTTKEASGAVIAVAEMPIAGLSQFILLDWYDNLAEECSLTDESTSEVELLDDNEEISLPIVTSLFTECDDSERSVAVIESASVPGYGVYIVAQSEESFDENLLQQIVSTIEFNPDFAENIDVEQDNGDDEVVEETIDDEVNDVNDVNDINDIGEGRSVSRGSTKNSVGEASAADAAADDASADDDSADSIDPNGSDIAPAIAAAKELAAEGKVEEAVAAFEEAFADDPSAEMSAEEATVAALIEAAQSLYAEDKAWQALERYSDVLELDPTNGDALVGRASVYQWFEEMDKALDDLTAAIELGGEEYDYAEAYSERGYIYYQLDEFERTAADLTRAIEKDPNKAWYFELRGYANLELDQNDEAVSDFTNALELDLEDYNYKWVYINRASAYRDLDEFERALADATNAIELDPGYTWGYELRGRIYSDIDEYEKSIADMTKAIEFAQEDYDYSVAYGYRGYAYYQQDEYFEAVSDLTEAIELYPRYTWAYEIRGNAHSENEQYDEAIADFTAAIELKDSSYDYSTIYTDKGIAHYELGEYNEAVSDLTEAIRLAPEYTWAYEWRGYTNVDLEEYDAAIEDFTAAIDLNQNGYRYQWAYSNRAFAYYNLGEFELALADLDEAINLDEEYVWAYDLRSELLGAMGRYEEAMADLRVATELEPRSASAWNSLCWYGALYGYADEVVDDACESAVEFASDEDKPYYRDSRGVARALTGDGEGALDDFKAFIDDYGDQDLRLEWIERLEAGEAPEEIFDEETIQVLIEESIQVSSSDETSETSETTESTNSASGSNEEQLSRETLLPSEPLNFTIEPSDLLEAVPPIGSLIAYSKDGSFRQQAAGDPLFMAVPSIHERPIDDASDFALERLELTANATIEEVTSHQAITIDGLDGFETVALGQATNADVRLIVYQVVLIQSDSYIVIKGLVGEESQDDFLLVFKEMARSLTLR